MRSRTRNRYLLRTVLILISTSTLLGDDYYIGYRFSSKNSEAVYERLSVSKAMTPCNGFKTNHFILFTRQPSEQLEATLRHHEEEFFTFASQQAIAIQSHQRVDTKMYNAIDTLTLPTYCYAVEFNDESAKITLLK